MADAVPSSAQMRGDAGGTADEAREAGGRASDEAPQQAEDQQGQDRAPRPDVPVGVMVVDRPPAERDQSGEQPMDEADWQIPDRLLHARGAAQCSGARNGS